MWLNTVSGEMVLKIHPDKVEGFTNRLKSILGEDGELNVSTAKECWRPSYLRIAFTYSTSRDIHEFSTMNAIRDLVNKNEHYYGVHVTFIDMRDFAKGVGPKVSVYDLRMSEMPVIEMEDNSFTADIESMIPWMM